MEPGLDMLRGGAASYSPDIHPRPDSKEIERASDTEGEAAVKTVATHTMLSTVRRAVVSSRRALSTGLVAESGGKHVPFGEAGTGAYTQLTKGCFDVIGGCEALATLAVDRALAARQAQGTVGSTFTIADFGTADGGTSLPLLRTLVAHVRAADPVAPIVVAYEDQAQNDWASVFHLTQGSLPNGPPTYLDGSVDNVYVLASGTSFYNQCLPPASVDFSFSATAMHWLTQLPCEIPDALHSACSSDTAALAAFEAQAAVDWERIMLMRAAELKPGAAQANPNPNLNPNPDPEPDPDSDADPDLDPNQAGRWWWLTSPRTRRAASSGTRRTA